MSTIINLKNKLLFKTMLFTKQLHNYNRRQNICDRFIIFNFFIPDGRFEKEILCLLFSFPNSLFQHSLSKNNLFSATQKQTNYTCLCRSTLKFSSPLTTCTTNSSVWPRTTYNFCSFVGLNCITSLLKCLVEKTK